MSVYTFYQTLYKILNIKIENPFRIAPDKCTTIIQIIYIEKKKKNYHLHFWIKIKKNSSQLIKQVRIHQHKYK